MVMILGASTNGQFFMSVAMVVIAVFHCLYLNRQVRKLPTVIFFLFFSVVIRVIFFIVLPTVVIGGGVSFFALVMFCQLFVLGFFFAYFSL